MKNVNILTFTISVTLALTAPSASGQCDRTFVPATGTWQKNANWLPAIEPGPNDVACISGQHAFIHHGFCSGGTNDGAPCVTDVECPPGPPQASCVADPAFAKAIILTNVGLTDGEITIGDEANLTISAPSTLDGGEICIETGTAQLLIDDDLTIFGGQNGGVIKAYALPFPGGQIAPADAACSGAACPVLTLKGFDNSDRLTSLFLHHALVIEVELVNDAYVIADHGTLVLKNKEKRGSGYWIAESHGPQQVGTLKVQATVKGDGKWQINHADAKIEFSVPCPDLTGDFDITTGTLEVKSSITTSGNLLLTDPAVINVDMGHKAIFD